MTDRLRGFTVTLTTDIREDDAEAIANAIRMIKGVLDVSPIVADSTDWMAQARAKDELRRKLFEVLK